MTDNQRLGYISQRLEKEPGAGAIILLAENYFHQQNYAAAVEASRRGLELFPDNLELRLLLGQSLFALHCPAEAEETLLPLVAVIRHLGQVFDIMKQLYQQRGMVSEAQKAADLYELLQGLPGSTRSETAAPPPAAPGAERIPGRVKALQILQKWQQVLQTQQYQE